MDSLSTGAPPAPASSFRWNRIFLFVETGIVLRWSTVLLVCGIGSISLLLSFLIGLFAILCLTEVPRFYDEALGLVDVFLVSNILDTNPHTVLCEDHVLLAHPLRGRLTHLSDAEVNVVEDEANAAHDAEGEDQREDLSEEREGHGVSDGVDILGLSVCLRKRRVSKCAGRMSARGRLESL